jgi:hypothetical protein
MSGEPQGTIMLTIHESIVANGVASVVRRGWLITLDQLSPGDGVLRGVI